LYELTLLVLNQLKLDTHAFTHLLPLVTYPSNY